MTTLKRKHPADRREDILNAAITLARDGNLYTMSGHQIAKQADCARALVNYYYATINTLRAYVIRWAVRHDDAAIMAQAMLKGDPLVISMSNKQRALVAQHMSKG